jgi:hypothetical protein
MTWLAIFLTYYIGGLLSYVTLLSLANRVRRSSHLRPLAFAPLTQVFTFQALFGFPVLVLALIFLAVDAPSFVKGVCCYTNSRDGGQ